MGSTSRRYGGGFLVMVMWYWFYYGIIYRWFYRCCLTEEGLPWPLSRRRTGMLYHGREHPFLLMIKYGAKRSWWSTPVWAPWGMLLTVKGTIISRLFPFDCCNRSCRIFTMILCTWKWFSLSVQHTQTNLSLGRLLASKHRARVVFTLELERGCPPTNPPITYEH